MICACTVSGQTNIESEVYGVCAGEDRERTPGYKIDGGVVGMSSSIDFSDCCLLKEKKGEEITV